jgi:hypothetical protein
MCVQPIDAEVSISNMMFGFACAGLLLARGTLEISVGAPKALLTKALRKNTQAPSAAVR